MKVDMETEVRKELMTKVEKALDSIRPYLEADGGNVKIRDITPENTVVLELLGSCSSCPMSAMTMKAGIEQAIIKEAPEIKSVIAIHAGSAA